MLDPKPANYTIQRLSSADEAYFRGILAVFAEAFEEPDVFLEKQPSAAYLREMLAGEDFIALAALEGDRAIGGLVAYVWRKFEQERKEIYIYDLGVVADHRRKGVAAALIAELKRVAAEIGVYLIIIQTELANTAAAALYRKHGKPESVLSFDVPVE